MRTLERVLSPAPNGMLLLQERTSDAKSALIYGMPGAHRARFSEGLLESTERGP